MEASRGKLLDLTLVNKYYPVANYSYPRKSASGKDNFGPVRDLYYPRSNRSSLGSEASAPGLIDDYSDNSEVSLDDDYQHHNAHEAQLWDSFWPMDDKKTEEGDKFEVNQKKQYPALLSTAGPGLAGETQRNANWPLASSSPPRERETRKPAASYSAFPRPTPAPPPRSTSLQRTPAISRPSSPVKASSRPASPAKALSRPTSPEKLQVPTRPPRPSRPSNIFLSPCLEEAEAPITTAFAPSASRTFHARPLTPDERRPRAFSPVQDRPATSHESTKAFSSDSTHTIIVVPQSPLPSPSPNSFLFPIPPMGLAPPSPLHLQQPCDMERHSYFDWDDDSDAGESDEEPPSSATRRFFRFHKRGESEMKPKKSEDVVQKRSRAKTAPSGRSTPNSDAEDHKEEKKKGAFHRMLGRRSG